MIKKVDYIKNYGVFDDFKWNDTDAKVLSNFSPRNLIYGWNYSGKTTLSRIFSSLENNQNHPDFSYSSFRISTYDDKKIESNYIDEHSLSVRVFNTDFIEENLKWGGNLEPIIILGKDSIKHQNILKELENKISKNIETIESNQIKIRDIESYIASSKTGIGREIKQTLDIVNTFNTRNVQTYIDSQGTNYQKFILSDDRYSKNLIIYRNTEKLDDVSYNYTHINIDVDDLVKNVKEILNKTIIKKIQHNLDENPQVYNWIKSGKDLHEDKNICLFCDNPISAERWAFLNNIFSTENDAILEEIDRFSVSLDSLNPEINFFSKLLLYKEYQDEYEHLCAIINKKLLVIRKSITDLQEIIISKKNKLYETVPFKDQPIFPDLSNEVSRIIDIVKLHNNKNKSFEENKKNAKDKLINHFIAEFIKKSNFDEKYQKSEQYTNIIQQLTITNADLKSKIKEIQYLISEEIRGAKTINDLLNLYFGKDDIELDVNDDKKYQLVRNGKIAKNLSEGEKTAISFSYFLAKLNDKNTNLNKTVVYIDDPISSLDSNHLYNTFALIKNKLRTCNQLFISTHNYEFFKLLRDDSFFKEYNKSQTKKASYYLVRRRNKTISDFTNLPNALKKYNSEYHFLFTTLLALKDKDDIDDSYLFTVPNMSRKLLEIFTSFKIPNTKITLDQRLIRLCNSEHEAHRIYKFVNHMSHSDSITFSIEFPTNQECKEILILIFDMINKIDNQHYSGMKDIAKKINNIAIE